MRRLSQALGTAAGADSSRFTSEVIDVRAKQQLNRGYSDGMARGIELVVAPLVMGAIGWMLDGWLGTGPFLAIAMGAFGVAGVFAKLWAGYDREMQVVQEGKPWTRDGSTTVASNGDEAVA